MVLVSGDATSDCRVPADPDILGLGVRLGLYFQLSSTWILQLVRREEAIDTFLPTGFFFISFFIAVVFSTAKGDFALPGALIASTWYPILFYTALFSFDFRGLNKKKQGIRYTLSFSLLSATAGYNVWFWFKGLDEGDQSQCMDPRVFFFANLDAKGGVSVVFKILTISFLIFSILTTFGVVGKSISDNGWDPYEDDRPKNVPGETTISKSISAEAAVLVPAGSSHDRGDTAGVTEARTETNDAFPDTEIFSSDPSPNILPATTTALALAVNAVKNEPGSVEIESISPSPPAPLRDAKTENTVIDPVASCVVSNVAMPPEPIIIPVSPPPESITNSTPKDDPEGPDNHNYNIAIGAFLFLALYIVPAELQLRWNHIDGVNTVDTTGQIIPLSLGSLSLIRSIYLLKDANWVKLKTEKVEDRIKTLKRKMTMQTVDERPPAEDV